MTDNVQAAEERAGPNLWLAVFWAVTFGLLVWLVLWAATSATKPNLSEAGAAEMLAIVSLVAVVIERIIEGMWSVIGKLRHGWWPMNAFGDAVQSLIDESNAAAIPAFEAVEANLEAAKEAAAGATAKLQSIESEITKIRQQKDEYRKQVVRIGKLAKNSERAQLLGTLAFQASNRLDTAYGETIPKVRQAFNDASQVVTGLNDIVAGFKDNPAKKLVSIAFGSIIGLAIAGIVGLDLFAAAGAPLANLVVSPQLTLQYLGVALTGLVVGLGANPTHEIVKYVSEAAKARRTSNVGRPNVSGSPDERDEQQSVSQIVLGGPLMGITMPEEDEQEEEGQEDGDAGAPPAALPAAGRRARRRTSPARRIPGMVNLR